MKSTTGANSKRDRGRKGKRVSRRELAEILGYSYTSIPQMKLPCEPQGKGRGTFYHTAEVIEELIKRKVDERSVDASDLKQRGELAAIVEREINITMKTGSLVPMVIVERIMSGLAISVRDSVMSLGVRMASKWVGMNEQQIRESCQQEGFNLLGELSESYESAQFSDSKYMDATETASEVETE